MADDRFREMPEAYALGALDGVDVAEFRDHLAAGCPACEGEVAAHRAVLGTLPRDLAAPLPGTFLRDQVLDLSEAPRLPLDLTSFDWVEIVPGVKLHVMKEDPSRGMRACLVWGQAGAKHPLHRHLGDENILVLKGRVRDHRATYGPGEICRSRAGFIHTEEVVPGEDCICYVTYYGDLEMLES